MMSRRREEEEKLEYYHLSSKFYSKILCEHCYFPALLNGYDTTELHETGVNLVCYLLITLLPLNGYNKIRKPLYSVL